MKRKLIIYSASLIFASLSVKSQDYHVTHFDVASLYLNPATTGMYGLENVDYKVYFDQRSQWRAIGVKPFLTTYLAYDMPYKIKRKKIGLGGYVINNNGGIGNFNTLTMMASAAYNILDYSGNAISVESKGNDKHLLTVGLQMGLFYRSTHPNSLNYDVQYSYDNGGAFDQNINNNEAYNRLNITRFDANYGLYYKFLDKEKKAHPYAGMSIGHLTRPNESLTGANSKLPIKWIGHGGCDIKLDRKMDLNPRILYMNQARASEFTFGALFYYRLNENYTKVYGGFDYRWKDAFIVNIGLKHESYAVRMSYDINTSYLKNFTRYRGAFEISIIYFGKKGTSFLKALSSF